MLDGYSSVGILANPMLLLPFVKQALLEWHICIFNQRFVRIILYFLNCSQVPENFA